MRSRFGSSKQTSHRKHAALALKHFGTDEGKALVVKKLEKMAGKNVRFLGRAGVPQMLTWYRRAKLLLFPQVEDFGIVAVEVMGYLIFVKALPVLPAPEHA